MVALLRVPVVLWLLLATLASLSFAALIPGPLVAMRTYSDLCTGANCTNSFYNVPNQCNPIWTSSGSIARYTTMPEACSMSAGFCSTTRYSDAACTMDSRSVTLTMRSVGLHANNESYWTFETSDDPSGPAKKPFIYLEQRSLAITATTKFGGIHSLTIPNAVGCQSVTDQSTGTAIRSALVTSTCADNDPFIQLSVFTSTDCSSPSGSTSLIADMSARVDPRNGSLSVPSIYSGGLQTTAKCYGGTANTLQGTFGVVYISYSTASCDAPTNSNWFVNAAVGSCVPLRLSGANTTVVNWVQILQQCSTEDRYLSYHLYSTSTCTGSYIVQQVTLGVCSRGYDVFAKYECLTSLSTPATQNMISFNISSSDGLSYRNYAFKNAAASCQPAPAIDKGGQIDFYFKSPTGCTRDPLQLMVFGLYSDASCSTVSMLSGSVNDAITDMTNAYNRSLSYSISCLNAATSTTSTKVPRLYFDVLGLASCTAETPSGVYATVSARNDDDSIGVCTPITYLNQTVAGYIILPSTCSPELEFVELEFFTSSSCAATGETVAIPLGSDRCHNLPGAQLSIFGGRAVRARCYGGEFTATSALSYAYVEEYDALTSCTSKLSAARSFALAQSTTTCTTAYLWRIDPTPSCVRFEEVCLPGDPVAFLSVSKDSGATYSPYAWKTTYDVGTAPNTTYVASASTFYPPQCNIGILLTSVVANKITCFGTYSVTKPARNLMVSSGLLSTRIYSNTAVNDTCYEALATAPADTTTMPPRSLTHVCSPQDTVIRYETSNSTVCAAVNEANATTIELNVEQSDGSVTTCYQSPSAAAASSDSYVIMETYTSQNCSGSVSNAYNLRNTPEICQANSYGSSIILAETCYEDDPFVTIQVYVNSYCSGIPANYTFRQGSSVCNSESSSIRIRCLLPPSRPSGLVSAHQSKIWFQRTTSTNKRTFVIENGPSITNASCSPLISPTSGVASVIAWARFTDGRCSSEDVMARVSFFSDALCNTTLTDVKALFLGENVTNSASTTNYTMSCYTGGEIVEPKAQSVLVRTAFSDNSCVYTPQTTVTDLHPDECTPVEGPDMATGVSLWVKSDVSCGKASPDATGLNAMNLNYYTSSTCSSSSKYANADHLYPTSGNASIRCSIGNVFSPQYSTSNAYLCAKTRTYQDPCSGSSPGDSFRCIEGAWVSPGSVSTETVVIGSSTTAVVSGNLTVSSSIVVTGASSSLTVTECLYLNGSISITLTSEDLELLTSKYKAYVILSYSGDNCTNASDLSTVSVAITSTDSGCKKLKTSNQSTKQTLTLAFSLDDSNCGKTRWWVILVSVVGALVIIVIAVVLLAVFVPAVRNCIRPFSQKRAPAGV